MMQALQKKLKKYKLKEHKLKKCKFKECKLEKPKIFTNFHHIKNHVKCFTHIINICFSQNSYCSSYMFLFCQLF